VFHVDGDPAAMVADALEEDIDVLPPEPELASGPYRVRGRRKTSRTSQLANLPVVSLCLVLVGNRGPLRAIEGVASRW